MTVAEPRPGYGLDGEELPLLLATPATVADALEVTSNAVWTWSRRRDRNGFPEPIGHTSLGRVQPLYDLNEVLRWREGYRPSRGGAPPGNRNAVGNRSRSRAE